MVRVPGTGKHWWARGHTDGTGTAVPPAPRASCQQHQIFPAPMRPSCRHPLPRRQTAASSPRPRREARKRCPVHRGAGHLQGGTPGTAGAGCGPGHRYHQGHKRGATVETGNGHGLPRRAMPPQWAMPPRVDDATLARQLLGSAVSRIRPPPQPGGDSTPPAPWKLKLSLPWSSWPHGAAGNRDRARARPCAPGGVGGGEQSQGSRDVTTRMGSPKNCPGDRDGASLPMGPGLLGHRS